MQYNLVMGFICGSVGILAGLAIFRRTDPARTRAIEKLEEYKRDEKNILAAYDELERRISLCSNQTVAHYRDYVRQKAELESDMILNQQFIQQFKYIVQGKEPVNIEELPF